MILGVYWSVWLYMDWEMNPVYTTVVTSALDVRKIPFPSVTICQNGFAQTQTGNIIEHFYTKFIDKCMDSIGKVRILLIFFFLYVIIFYVI